MKITRIKDVKLPNRGTSRSAGIDFFIPNDFLSSEILPGDSIKILSGIKASVPTGYALIAFNKSGVALSGLQVGACVVDEDYQGEISLHLINTSNNIIKVNPGQKITQFILLPVFYDSIEEVSLEDLYEEVSDRGEGAFGSTGKN